MTTPTIPSEDCADLLIELQGHDYYGFEGFSLPELEEKEASYLEALVQIHGAMNRLAVKKAELRKLPVTDDVDPE